MTTYVAHTAAHKTLGVATEDIVTLDVYSKSIQIINRGAAASAIYVTVGALASATAGVPGTPAVVAAANDTFVVVAGTANNPLQVNWPGNQNTACVRLICASGEPYSVQGINEPFGS